MLEPMGSYLRRERELRKVSIEDLSNLTKIRPEYLKAIESERFEKLPGLTFVKGYLRSYASGIGLMPEDVVLRFDDYLARLSGETQQIAKRKFKRVAPKKQVITFGILGILIFLLWLIKTLV